LPPKQEAEPYDAKNRFFDKQSSSWETAILATRVVPVNQPQPDVEFPLDRLPLGNSTPQHRVAVAGKFEAGEHDVSFPPLNESLRISRRELPVLKRHAEAGDVEAALRLAEYYGVFLNPSEKRNRDIQIHYYKIAATYGSQAGFESLIFIYSISEDRYDLSKACYWRRELKRFAMQRNVQIQSDAEWYYGLYSEYYVARRSTSSKRNKRLGLHFLMCAASLGLEEAQRELAEVYSDDPDARNSTKADYSEQRQQDRNQEATVFHDDQSCCVPSDEYK
jgi:TPR repeat protein